MISAWEIYWIMQLDTIAATAAVVAVLGIFVTAMAWAFWADEDTPNFSIAVPLLTTFIWLCSIAAHTFLPSTKTAATMFIVPAIVNNENAQQEAGELYQLAKQALVNKLEIPQPTQEQGDE